MYQMERFRVEYRGLTSAIDPKYPAHHHFFIPTWAHGRVRAWCYDNTMGSMEGYFCFFIRDEDAVAFRLRWCGVHYDA